MSLLHYVYGLIDPRNNELFYIGKGGGYRIVDHENFSSKTNLESMKNKKIQNIKSQCGKVRKVILAKGYETEAEAFAIESLLIHDAYSSSL